MSTLHTPELGRLIDIIADENAVLRSNAIVPHNRYTEGKVLALRDLMGLQRSAAQMPLGKHLVSDLRRLKELLAENARLLKIHITAVGEVADLLVEHVRREESDGTYSRSGNCAVR